MSEVQGWIAIALGIVTLIGVIWAMSANFTTVRVELRHMGDLITSGFKRNDTAHDVLHKRIDKLDTEKVDK